jgi:hypothetical protein
MIDKLGAVMKAFVFNEPQVYPAGNLLYHCSLVGGYGVEVPGQLAIDECKEAIIRCSIYAEDSVVELLTHPEIYYKKIEDSYAAANTETHGLIG